MKVRLIFKVFKRIQPKLNLRSSITIVFLFMLVIYGLLISLLIRRISSEPGSLHPLLITLYVIPVVTFGVLTYIFYEELRSWFVRVGAIVDSRYHGRKRRNI